MCKPTLSRSPPSAIPILMRLPDLRLSKQVRDFAEPAAEPLVAESPIEESPVKDALVEQHQITPAETPVENAPPAPTEREELPQLTASSAGDSPSLVADTQAETVCEPAASLPADPQPVVVASPVVVANSEAVAQPETVTPPEAVANPETVANEEPIAVVPHKVDLTDASPADAAEPVAPAAARRQRALERQRRQTAEPPPRTWWTTHAPVIAIGFLVALVLTICLGRINRARHASDDQASMELPELEIDTGDGNASLSPGMSEPGTLAVDPPKEATTAAVEVKPAVKSPPLLSAKPKATVPNEPALVENPRITAKPSNESEITNPYVSAPAVESVRAAAELSSEAAADYPSTEAAVYRPGGRVPREARVPNYPQTSTPHLR